MDFFKKLIILIQRLGSNDDPIKYIGNLVSEDLSKQHIPECLLNEPGIAKIDINYNKENFKSFNELFLNSEKGYKQNCKDMYDDGEFSNKFKILVETITTLTEKKEFIYYLDPKELFFFEDKLVFDQNVYDKLVLKGRNKKLDMQNYDKAFLFPKARKKQSVESRDLDNKGINSLIAYLFFVSLIPENQKIANLKLVNHIKYLHLFNDSLPVELKPLLNDAIKGKIDKPAASFFHDIKNCFKNSVNRYADNRVYDLSVSYYSQKGLKKRYNEDTVASIKSTNEKSVIMMVADGVSTAEIGNGGMVSAEVLNFFRNREAFLKNELDNLENLSDDFSKWEKESKKVINNVITKVNNSTINKLNNIISEENILRAEEKALMSSTVNIAIVTGNWCVIGWLGDSPAFLSRNNKMIELLNEHNAEQEKFVSYYNDTDCKFKDDNDAALSRVVPMIKKNNDGKLIADNIEDYIEFRYFFLKKNDILLMGSDGIIDNMSGVLLKDKIKEISDVLSSNSKNNYAYEITKKGISGVDNITAVVLNIN